MKATTITVIGLTAACVCAQPIIPREYAGVPRSLADLEDRKVHGVHINWGKVKNAFKKVDWLKVGETAANIGLKLLELRSNEDELFAREYNDYLEARDFDDDYLEARDFDDDYLEQRDLDLELRDEQTGGERPHHYGSRDLD